MSTFFLGIADVVRKLVPNLKIKLLQADIEKEEREYVASAIAMSFFWFVTLFVIFSVVLFVFEMNDFKISFLIAAIFSFFIFMQKIIYPIIIAGSRIKNIERNLLPVLQSILVQMNSGVVLFEIIVNISKANHGTISKEFIKVVKEINGGKPQIDALEDLAARNPSLFFRRSIWQIINGMKSGSDISLVVKETISSLSEEQIIQIQDYGVKLAPMAMFYMFAAVIIPALSITFILLFLSFSGLSASAAKAIFYVLYAGILFSQIMFVGLINSRRPNLL
ncbi:MAG: type II secretion system F family protein [archaeon]